MLRSIIFVVIWGLLTTADLPAQDEPCPHIDNLRQSLRSRPYLTLQFTQTITSDVFESVDTVAGILWAGQNGLFRLSLPGQEMVSNGILYWSYSQENQQVLVDSIVKMGDWDPLTILYDPENIYKCLSEETSESNVTFDLQANDSLTEPSSFRLTVSNTNYIPRSLEYRDASGSRIFIDIKQFEPEAEIPDSIFNFVPPDGVEIILMP